MASILGKKEKTYKTPIFAIFFIIFGAILLGLSIKEINDYTYKNNNYIKTDAKVIKHIYDNNKVKETVLEYSIGEETYTVSSNNSLDKIKSYGSTIIIKYNPNNPEDVFFPNSGINIFIPVLALVILATGFSITIVMIAENIRRIKRLTKIIKNKNNNRNIKYNSIRPNIGLTEAINQNRNVRNNNITIDNSTSNNINNTNSNSNSNDIKINNNNINKTNNNSINDNKINNEKPIDNQKTIKQEEEKHSDEIIEIPFAQNEFLKNKQSIHKDINIDKKSSNNNKNHSNKNNYIDFISEISNNEIDIPDFIPNMKSLKK